MENFYYFNVIEFKDVSGKEVFNQQQDLLILKLIKTDEINQIYKDHLGWSFQYDDEKCLLNNKHFKFIYYKVIQFH